jgi:adenylosuccinate synthase
LKGLIMSVDVVLGLQRGDEGKGRFVDLMAKDYDIVARFNGGCNAGHTIVYGSNKVALHQVPSGIINPGTLNVMGNGVLIDPVRLCNEIDELQVKGIKVSPENLVISDMAHLTLPHHISEDEIREAGLGGQGSTKRGIAQVARDKYERKGLRAEQILDNLSGLRQAVVYGLQQTNEQRSEAGLETLDVNELADRWIKSVERLTPFITDTVSLVQKELKRGGKLLAEGAQAFGLDIEYGMYPYTSSSHPTPGGVLNGLGVNYRQLNRVIGVAKAIPSHVGGGPFVTEIKNHNLAATVRGHRGEVDAEYGASTGRERRVGYLDLPALRRAIDVTGLKELIITKLDSVPKMGPVVKIAVAYELNGQQIDTAPGSAARLTECKPVYRDFSTWSEDISEIRKFDDLPETAKQLVNFIADELGVEVNLMGVGPERDQVVRR